VNDYDICYTDVGQGIPLVCVHGTLGGGSSPPACGNSFGTDYKIAQHVADVAGL